MKPLATRPPTNSISSSLGIERSPSNVSPSPFHYTKDFALSSPTQSVTQTIPAPVQWAKGSLAHRSASRTLPTQYLHFKL
jgi:hypothetical protein